MRDVDPMLHRLAQLRERSPIPPTLKQVAIRSRKFRRRRGALVTGLAALSALVVGGLAFVSGARNSTDVRLGVGSSSGEQQTDQQQVSTTPQSFLDEVLTIVAEKAYFATPTQVERWRAEGSRVAAAAAKPSDTYPFIARVIDELDHNDPNTQGQGLWAPDRAAAYAQRSTDEAQGLPISQVNAGVGYVNLTPTTATPDSSEGARYVEHVRAALSEDTCGWILDLRASYPNAVGQLETMLSAAAPLLPNGPAVGYQYRGGTVKMLAVRPDGSIVNATDGTVVAPPGGPRSPTGMPVAVLQGAGTTNVYESLLLAFRGRDTVRTFGEPSAGQPVSKASFPLSDGSLLWLTTGVASDRASQTYDGPIAPDVSASAEAVDGADPARAAADAWLRGQNACQ